MSELAQKQVTPDTSKDMQKIFIFCFKYFMILNEKIYILFNPLGAAKFFFEYLFEN